MPLKGRKLKREGNALRFAGKTFRVFYSRPLPAGKIRDESCFAKDRRGNWFLNIAIEVSAAPARAPVRGVGIDLGLKDFAVFSDGTVIQAQRIYRDAQQQMTTAQRARKKRPVTAIHARFANRRRDFHQQLSTRLMRNFDYIAVANVNAAALAKTRMAKSILDAGRSTFRHRLPYKAVKQGAWFEEVDERFATQTCSCCGAKPSSQPKGIAGLGVKEWQCSVCGCNHDRDVNAALNILRRGRATLVAGIPVF